MKTVVFGQVNRIIHEAMNTDLKSRTCSKCSTHFHVMDGRCPQCVESAIQDAANIIAKIGTTGVDDAKTIQDARDWLIRNGFKDLTLW